MKESSQRARASHRDKGYSPHASSNRVASPARNVKRARQAPGESAHRAIVIWLES
jgi:hypothetical protein